MTLVCLRRLNIIEHKRLSKRTVDECRDSWVRRLVSSAGRPGQGFAFLLSSFLLSVPIGDGGNPSPSGEASFWCNVVACDIMG
jgi:hypothetical protein